MVRYYIHDTNSLLQKERRSSIGCANANKSTYRQVAINIGKRKLYQQSPVGFGHNVNDDRFRLSSGVLNTCQVLQET